MNIALISCVKKKMSCAYPAKDLYDSTWFRYAWKYAWSLNPDKVFILSAKYGLVDPETVIAPYEETLNTRSDREIRAWADIVLASLREETDATEDSFVVLAGKRYRKHLIGHLPNHTIPMEGLGIGKQLKWLKEQCASMICERLHEIFNELERHKFPFGKSYIPKNGIYVLFEKGECAHGNRDRIVRIGTHTGQGNLEKRLTEHFLNENKDRSIFRKNIGRALLRKEKDPFAEQWEIDLTSSEAKQRHSGKINFEKLSETEKKVSAVIRDTFTFCVLPMEDKQQRLSLRPVSETMSQITDSLRYKATTHGLLTPFFQCFGSQ